MAVGAGLLPYGVAVRFLFPGPVPGAAPGGAAVTVPIFPGPVFLATGAVPRLGD